MEQRDRNSEKSGKNVKFRKRLGLKIWKTEMEQIVKEIKYILRMFSKLYKKEQAMI